MPLYEYVCESCGAFFEYWLRNAASKEEIACPECQSMAVNKKFSTFGVKGGATSGGGSFSGGGDACSTGGG